jgi:GAF domain-containing protein
MTEATMANRPRDISRLQLWRENILQAMFYTLLVIGLLMLITNSQTFILSGQWIMVGVAGAVYVAVIVITFLRRLPFVLRASVVIGAFYILWPINFALYGLTGDGRVWFLLMIVIASILFGLRAGLGALALISLTFGSMAFVEVNGMVPDTINWSLTNWVSAGFTLLFMGSVITLSIGYLLDSLGDSMENLEDTIRSEQSLANNLQAERAELEVRSQDLERRLGQLRTAAEISRSFGTMLNPDELMQHVCELVRDRFNLYYVGIFLNDERNHYAELRAGTGEAGQRMLDQNHRLTVGGSSMVGWATAHLRPRVALDVGSEAVRFRNPNLPLTRSEGALPLAIGGQSIGAMTIQSSEPNAFDQDDILVLQGIADSLAVALENARLFTQIEHSLKEIQALNQAYVGDSWRDILSMQDELAFTVENENIDPSDTSEFNIPLTLREDQVIGNIKLEGTRGALGSEEMEFLQAVSTQAALALESARLLDESQRRVQREQALNEMTAKFSRSLDFDTLMQTVVREMATLPSIQDAAVFFNPGDIQPISQPEALSSNGDAPDEPIGLDDDDNG